MGSNVGFSTRVTSWELINDNLQPHLEGMPQVRPLQEELAAAIAEARSLIGEQELAKTKLRAFTHQRQEMERRGEILRRRVVAHLRGTFGYTSDQLHQFGITPLKTRPRRPRVAPPAQPAPDPAAPETATTPPTEK